MVINLSPLVELLGVIKRKLDFVPLLAIRLYLAPIFIAAGLHKMHSFDSIVDWFGNAEWGLGLPFPYLMALLATATEIIGGFALVVGVGTRLIAIPLTFTMIVAAGTAHWDQGWFAIASSNPETSAASVLAPIGFPGAQESLDNSVEVGKRLTAAKSILREHGNYSWLTETGSFVVLNNGIEFAVTYMIMLLVLLAFGPGRYLSVDYWAMNLFGPKFGLQKE